MAKTLKLTFDTDESTRVIGIVNPKEDIDRDACEAAMTAIVESGAFDDVTAPVKAVIVDSNSEILYEA